MSNKPPFTPDKPAKTPGVVVGKKRPEQMSRARHLARLALQKQWKKVGEEVEQVDEMDKEMPLSREQLDNMAKQKPAEYAKLYAKVSPEMRKKLKLPAKLPEEVKDKVKAKTPASSPLHVTLDQAYAKGRFGRAPRGSKTLKGMGEIELVKKLTKEQVGLDEGRESRSEYDANLAMAPVKKAATNASLPEINALMRKQKQKQHPKTKGFLQRLLNREEVQAESYEKAQQHKALAAKALETSDTSGYNKHMSDHHEEMGKWHESKGRSDLAQREFDKAEQSHEKFLSTTLKGNIKMKKEEVKQIDESKTPEYYDNLAKKHTADGKKGTRANMVYASAAAGRARRAAKMLRNGESQEAAWKHYQGTTMKKEEVEQVEYIEEKLSKRDPASKWIHDFVASDNPKFAGKSKKMRINMALGAYYAAQRAAPKNEEVALDEKLDAVGREDADVNNDMKVDVTDKYLLARRAAIRNAIKSKKK